MRKRAIISGAIVKPRDLQPAKTRLEKREDGCWFNPLDPSGGIVGGGCGVCGIEIDPNIAKVCDHCAPKVYKALKA